MEARATLKYARISPRKVKIVLDLIRNQDADKAMAILKFTPKSACEYLEKLLASAMANAENNHNMDKDNLYVAECFVTPGPIMKRITQSFITPTRRPCGLTFWPINLNLLGIILFP